MTMPADMRAALEAKGDTQAGRKKIFENATIRQIKLAYGWEEHRQVIGALEKVMKQTGTKNPSEVMPKLLEYWEAGHRRR